MEHLERPRGVRGDGGGGGCRRTFTHSASLLLTSGENGAQQREVCVAFVISARGCSLDADGMKPTHELKSGGVALWVLGLQSVIFGGVSWCYL